MKRVTSLTLAACLLAGCGYSFGIRLPEGIETLEVPIFGNTTLVRGLEFELTETLAEELKSRTPARLVTRGGDAKLTGTVVTYEKVPVYESAGVVLAGRVKVTVTFSLVRTGSDKALKESTLEEAQDFDARAGILEEDARRKAMREIARRIVYEIETWEEEEKDVSSCRAG
jgi:hypothetical protein